MKSLGFLLLALLCSATDDTYRITVHLTFLPSARNPLGEVLAVSKTGGSATSGWQNKGVYQVPVSVEPADLFFYQGIGTDTLYVGSVAASADTTVQLRFPLTLRKNLFGHYYCPKCGKADKTVRIVHSEAPLARMIVTSTDTSYSSIIGREKYESCINGGGRGYCQRDKVRF